MDFRKKINGFIVCLPVIFVVAVLWQSAYSSENRLGPSFDCEKASTKVEKSICNDGGLSLSDRALNKLYKAKMAIPEIRDSVKKSQLEWLRTERAECENIGAGDSIGNDLSRVACLDSAYKERKEELYLFTAEPSNVLKYPPIKFKLMIGNQYPLCKEYVDMLNKSGYSAAPVCEREIIPEFSKFRPVKWVEITDKEEIKKIRKEQIMMEFLWPRDKQKRAESFWLSKEREMDSGNWPVLHKALIDMDHDGKEDSVYRFSVLKPGVKKYGVCTTLKNYFIKYESVSKTKDAYSHPLGVANALNSTSGQTTLFYFDNRIRMDFWKSWISQYQLNVSEIGSGPMSQICGVNMVK